MGDAACCDCGAFIDVETTRAAQVAAFANLIEDGTGALTAEELEALPNDSVVLTVGPVGMHSWVLSKKENGLLLPFEEFIDEMSIAEMVGYKTFLLQRGES
ncbi:hypothetical protein [Glutamicibacter sp. TV12E]|uniref:hypothetical protein n=1 Tax=Glutamicibacter sp. TV12E TaxID=3446362 RepID=UPI004034C5E7